MRPQRPPVTRTTLVMLVAMAGVVLGTQSRYVVGRIGWEGYLMALLLLAVGLAALARPRRLG